jgi:membrane protein DedA with SNARE-associated domain
LEDGAAVGEWLEIAVDWLVATIFAWGYPGIFVLMTIESSFVPFPSEVVLIPAGYLAAQGKMDAVAATGSGLAGSLFGAFVNYGLALWLGRPFFAWLERTLAWIPVGDHLVASERYFARHGEITTFVGRLIPGIRQLISLPAGLARMSAARFALYTGLGAGMWSTVLVAIGFWAGENEETWRPLLRDATLWVVAAGAALLGGYVWLHRRTSRIS